MVIDFERLDEGQNSSGLDQGIFYFQSLYRPEYVNYSNSERPGFKERSYEDQRELQ